jgi:hypothetical protein
MHSKDAFLEKCKVQKISEVSKEQLSVFYKKVYPERYKSLTENWQWWYRFDLNNSEPIMLTLHNEIIGQAAYLPNEMLISGKKIEVIWFQDYAVLPKFVGKGLGKLLCKEWMKICPNQMAICSPYSLRVLKKLGWSENYESKRLARPINFFNFLPVIKNLNVDFLNAPLKFFFKKKYKSSESIKPYAMENNLKILEDSFNLKKESHNPDFAHINRSKNWFDWRLTQCPYKKDIYFFKYNNNFAIVHIYNAKNIKRLNILFTYYTDYSEEDKLYSLIIKWSLDNNIDFIWLISKSKKFYHIFPKIFNKPLRFASWSSDQDISEILKKGLNDLQGIDSDIESGLYIE